VEAIGLFAWLVDFHNNLTFDTGVKIPLPFNFQHCENEAHGQIFISRFKLRNQLEIFRNLPSSIVLIWFAQNNN